MLHEMEQLYQLRADILGILPSGIEKDPHCAVSQESLLVLHTVHPKSIPVVTVADQIEGSDENLDDVTQPVEIHRPRFQLCGVDIALVVAAAPGQVAGIAFLYFRIVDAVIQIPGPDVQPNMAVPG